MSACKILVVEDEAIVAMDIRQRLESMHYEVTATVSNGRDAIEQISRNRPDLALMDIQIKGDIDGIETARRIQEEFDIPIIFLTANSDLSTVERAKTSGPLAYVLKPFEDRELLTSIEIAAHRHQLEQKLKASEAWLETVLRSIGDAVIATDRAGNVVFMNPEAERLSGRKYDVSINKPSEEILKLVDGASDKPAESPIKRCLETGQSVMLSHHVVLVTPAGGRTPIEDGASPIRNKRGELVGCVMVFRDVTQRLRVEDELRKHQEHLDQLVKERTAELSLANEQLKREIEEREEAEREVLSIVKFPDEDPGPVLRILADGTICYANKASAPILASWNCLVKQLVPENWIRVVLEVLDSKAVRTIEVAEGEQIFSLVLSPVPESGYVNIYGRDITRQRQSEESEQKLKRELERAQRAESLAVLAGGVAHDLNNMLAPVVGYPELILRRLPADSPIRKQVERIGVAAKEAADVIQDLLTLARRGRNQMVPVSFNNVLMDFFDSPLYVKLVDSNPRVEVITDLDSEPQNIMGSAPQLTKLIMNLVINAFDAMPDGGSLTITTAHSHLKVLEGGYDGIVEDDYIILRIKDTGVGIPAEHLGRLFEPYYSSKKMAGHCGTGLGLAVVYGVLKDHGGYFDVVSEVGKGTEFIMYFPVTDAQVIDSFDDGNSDPALCKGNEKVLIVDDSRGAREIARETLTALGYKVVAAENGREAVEYLKHHRVDIIMLDMIMEDDFDGLDTYRAVIKHRPGQKAIIVSGYASTDRVQKALALGAGQFVKKPYDLKTIASAIRQELDKTPPVKPLQQEVASSACLLPTVT